MYTGENTCLLSVYGHPLARQLAGSYKVEQRHYRTKYQHVVHVVSTHERASVGLPRCAWMQPGHAYLAYTIKGYEAGVFRRWAWILKDVIVFPNHTNYVLESGLVVVRQLCLAL